MEQGPMQRNSILHYLNAKIRILQYFVNETFVVMTRFLSGTAYCRNPSVFQLTKDYTCAYCKRQLKPVSTRNCSLPKHQFNIDSNPLPDNLLQNSSLQSLHFSNYHNDKTVSTIYLHRL